MKASYNLFCSELPEVIKTFTNLEIIKRDDKQYLKGILDIRNDLGDVCGSFLTEIHCSPFFPYRFPVLFETGGDIENYAEWHKYNNGKCCITVEADEILKCKYGITVMEFIRRYCIPFFANHIHRLTTGYYKNGEYLHEVAGIKQFYQEFFKCSVTETWISYFKHVFIKSVFLEDRNKSCFCGTGFKFKNCHKKVFDDMLLIGQEKILHDLMKVLK